VKPCVIHYRDHIDSTLYIIETKLTLTEGWTL